MNIHFHTGSFREVEVELHFTDGKIYQFTQNCKPQAENTHTVVGRWPNRVNKLLVKTEDYWYDEPLSVGPDDSLTIELEGREKYTQMLRDAAMRVKPEGE
jgi:hypothetical protein